MISKFMYFVRLPCSGKSTFISNNYSDAGHLCDMLSTLLSTTHPFDDYSFEGEVDDFFTWTMQGADYNVWNLELVFTR